MRKLRVERNEIGVAFRIHRGVGLQRASQPRVNSVALRNERRGIARRLRVVEKNLLAHKVLQLGARARVVAAQLTLLFSCEVLQVPRSGRRAELPHPTFLNENFFDLVELNQLKLLEVGELRGLDERGSLVLSQTG